ncbi:pentapeptide repeat-containing protein [Streptomyces rubiginosohelvolus]|uniref:pentapeptide repeat-containing protein n=1 Tax=Streptomyces rubiginosohelvolus TaxID=67362 RepID=UPI003F8E40D6
MTTKKRVPWLAIVAVLAGTTVFGLLLWKGPWWFDGAHLRSRDLEPADGVVITGFRTALVAVGVALTAAVGLIYTHRNHRATLDQLELTRTKDREQADLTRESQYTDLYVDAIKLLAAKDSTDGSGLTERLGGIYALERVMRDSRKDHPMVVQVLAAFVRQHAPRASLEVEGDLMPEDVTNPSDDVQAALTVLGRRPDRGGEEGVIDLSYTDLSRANLADGRFDRVNFSGTQLYGAQLAGTKMRGALLGGAELTAAQLPGTDLRGADLRGERPFEVHVPARISLGQLLSAEFDGLTYLPEELEESTQVQHRLWSGSQ